MASSHIHSHPPGPRPPPPPPPATLPPDNETMFQGFEWYVPADAAHWRRLAGALPGLRGLGVSSLWLPPACKAGWATGNGYDAYDLWDLGEFAQKGASHTKWGTKAELAALAARAARCGVRVLFDAVLNHKAAADRAEAVLAVRVDPKDRTAALDEPREIEAWCKYDFPGRGSTYSPMKWTKEHFNGIDYDHRTKTNGIWRFKGKDWATDVDEELGNYDYLMFANVDHSHPEVRRDLFEWIKWLPSQLPLGGLRLDAIKHYSASFLRDFVRHVDATVGRDWFIVGEYWREDSEVLAKYIEYMDHRLSLFDVRLVSNFSRLSTCPNADLRSVFEGALVELKPNNAVTFVTNHDTMEGQSLEVRPPTPRQSSASSVASWHSNKPHPPKDPRRRVLPAPRLRPHPPAVHRRPPLRLLRRPLRLPQAPPPRHRLRPAPGPPARAAARTQALRLRPADRLLRRAALRRLDPRRRPPAPASAPAPAPPAPPAPLAPLPPQGRGPGGRHDDRAALGGQDHVCRRAARGRAVDGPAGGLLGRGRGGRAWVRGVCGGAAERGGVGVSRGGAAGRGRSVRL